MTAYHRERIARDDVVPSPIVGVARLKDLIKRLLTAFLEGPIEDDCFPQTSYVTLPRLESDVPAALSQWDCHGTEEADSAAAYGRQGKPEQLSYEGNATIGLDF